MTTTQPRFKSLYTFSKDNKLSPMQYKHLLKAVKDGKLPTVATVGKFAFIPDTAESLAQVKAIIGSSPTTQSCQLCAKTSDKLARLQLQATKQARANYASGKIPKTYVYAIKRKACPDCVSVMRAFMRKHSATGSVHTVSTTPTTTTYTDTPTTQIPIRIMS